MISSGSCGFAPIISERYEGAVISPLEESIREQGPELYHNQRDCCWTDVDCGDLIREWMSILMSARRYVVPYALRVAETPQGVRIGKQHIMNLSRL